MKPNALLHLLYDAMAQEIGITVTTDDPLRLRQKLYAERKRDPDFEVLSFVLSPRKPNSELWILKTKRKSDAKEK